MQKWTHTGKDSGSGIEQAEGAARRTINLVRKEKARIVHRVPLDGRNMRVLSPEGEYAGVWERGIEKEIDRVVQFERFGFVRIDSVGEDGVVAYFTHK